MKKISLQLYSIRETAGQNYAGAMRRVADMGYTLVEPAGYPGTTLEEAARIYKENGLQAASCHGRLPLGDRQESVLADMRLLGATYLITGFGAQQFGSVEDIKQVAEQFNQAAEIAGRHGIQIGYHNHWWEMAHVGGVPAYRIFLDHTRPEVLMELDTYWAKVGGCDPVEVVCELGARARLLHIKDGPGVREEPMFAVGQGVMDFPAIVAAAEHAEILVVELDRCATDMMEAVKQSRDYLVSVGLGA